MDWPASTTDIGVVERQHRHKGHQRTRRIARYDKSAGLVQERREVKGRRPYILAGPVLDYGADGPATLGRVNATVDATRKGKEKERWEWKFATADKDDQDLKFQAGKSSCLFPPTWKRPASSTQHEDVARRQKAASEQRELKKKEITSAIAGLEGIAGLDEAFLDALFDDRPVQATVPMDDADRSQDERDPNGFPIAVGNRLKDEIAGPSDPEPIKDCGNPNKIVLLDFSNPKADGDPVYFLAFPSGPDGRGLNISPFRKTRHRAISSETVFCPSATPCMMFPSPILQIAVSSYRAVRSQNRNTVYLAVRLELFTYIISVDVVIDLKTFRAASMRSRLFPLGLSPIRVQEIDRIDTSRTRGARHMDVAMHPIKRRECVLIDENGKIWRWRMVTRRDFTGQSTYGKISKLGRSWAKTEGTFYRIAWHEWDRHIIVATTNTVEVVDQATGTIRRVIDFMSASTRILDLYSDCDLEKAPYAGILTTESIVWFDPAHDGRIMLSWKHYLPKADDLRLLAIPTTTHMTMAVLSSSRDMLTAFAVEEAGVALRISVPPYDIFNKDQGSGQAVADGLIALFKEAGQETWRYFGIDLEGAVRSADLVSMTAIDNHDLGPQVQWSGPVEALNKLVNPSSYLPCIVGQVGRPSNQISQPKERDLQRFWNTLPMRARASRNRPLETDLMRRTIADQEELYGMGILTGLDLASWVHDDIDETIRQTAFLRGYDLDADAAIHQMAQDITHFTTSRLLRPLQPGLALSSTIGNKASRSLSRTTTGSSTRHQTVGDLTMAGFAEAKLAIDLCLAGIGPETEEWHDPQSSQLTQHGPSVEAEHADNVSPSYSLLRLRRIVPNHEKREGLAQTPDSTATMSFLLAQWQPGDDPSTYSWPGLTSHSTGTRIPLEEEAAAVSTQRSLPETAPAVGPSTQPQPLSQRRQHVAPISSHSQGIGEFASTQILPGPFANRQPSSFRRGPNKSRTIGF